MPESDPYLVETVKIVAADSNGIYHEVPMGNGGTTLALAVSSGIVPFSSLSGASAQGTRGSTVDLLTARANHLMSVIAAAGVTAGVVQLQGALLADGNWFTIGAVTLTGPGVFPVQVSGWPVRYLSTFISTAIAGGTVSAQIGSA